MKMLLSLSLIPLFLAGILSPAYSQWSVSGSNVYVTTSLVGIGTTSPYAKLKIATSNDNDPSTVYAWDTRHFVVGMEGGTGGGVGISYNQSNNYGIINALSPSLAWRNLVLQSGGGNVGIGTTSPSSKMHVVDAAKNLSTPNVQTGNSQFTIQATSASRTPGTGAALGFVLPASTDGSSPWEQGRILVTPDDGTNNSATGRMYLQTRRYSGTWDWNSNLVLVSNGNVGIGTANPGTYKLAVKGKIHSEEVVVETGWSDFVFDDHYKLKTLAEVEKYIAAHRHLPDIPSAEEVGAQGLSVGQMQAKLLQKIEELTLYVIELKKENQVLEARLSGLEDSK